MRNLALIAAAVAVLVATGAAVAHGTDGGARSITLSGRFAATTAGGSTTQSCTSSAGKTIATTKATYTGTSSGAPDLAGDATIAVRSTIDTTDGVGIVTGTLRAGKTKSHFSAVYDHGAIAGTASGHGATAHTQLLANISASFDPAAGFTHGKIGGGTARGSAVELALGSCASTRSRSERTVEGAITAVTAGSITVAGLTCVVPTSLAITVAMNYPIGTRVAIACSLVTGSETLIKIEKKSR